MQTGLIMTSSIRNTLAYMGLIPFFILAIAIFWPKASLFQFFLVAFCSYSAVIASFLAGSLWGQALHLPSVNRLVLFISSNVISLLAWASLLWCLLQQPVLALAQLLILYVVLYFLEKIYLWKNIEFSLLDRLHHYWLLRRNLTCIVILCHLIAIVALLVSADTVI